MLSAHHIWTELKLMCLLVVCAVMIAILSGSGPTESDQSSPSSNVAQQTAAPK